MTIYFAPPDEPLDGDNWQELGTVSEAILEIEPEIKAMSEQRLHTQTEMTHSFEFSPSKEFVNAMLGFDIYALRATVTEWLNRPAPMPSIPKAELWEIQDGKNRMRFYPAPATNHFASGSPQ